MKYIEACDLGDMIKSIPLAIIVSQFNQDITQALQAGAVEQLLQHGHDAQHLTIIAVPGAIEIPIVAQKLAEKHKFGAIIVLGAIIRGETDHYGSVCQQVSYGCQRVALKYNTPVIFEVLMTDNEAQAWDRVGGQHGHKGKEAVDIALSMCSILNQL